MKIFPQSKKVVVVAGGGSSGEEVTAEELRYSALESHKTPVETSSLQAIFEADEVHPVPQEDALLGILMTADETHPSSADAATLEVETFNESHPVASDAVAAIVSVSETVVPPAEDVAGIVIAQDESQPTPVEDVSGTQAVVVSEASHPASSDAVALVAEVQESHPAATDAVTLDVAALVESAPASVDEAAIGVESLAEAHPAALDESGFILDAQEAHAAAVDAATLDIQALAESHPASVDDVSGTQAQLQANESHPASMDVVELGSVLDESHRVAGDTGYTEVSGYLWPDTVASNTNFGSSGNAIDKDEGTSASCSANSSGLLNTTSNTTTVTLVISAPNPVLSDLSTISNADVVYRYTTSTNSLLSPAVNMQIQYSTNDGGAWTTLETVTGTAIAAVTKTVDITSVIGNDWSKVNGFRMRCTGTVTSGLGTTVIQASTAFAFFFGRLELTASKTY